MTLPLAHRLLQAARLLLASQWRTVTGAQRDDILDVMWAMYTSSYQKIGMHVKNPAEMLAKYDIWQVCIHDDRPIAFNLCTTTPLGLKTGLLGSDGSPDGRRAARQHARDRYGTPGVYTEVSHGVEKLVAGAPVVCAVYVAGVLNKTVAPTDDGVHYQRELEGVGVVTKKLVGTPKGAPSGPEGQCPIPKHPGKPMAPGDDPKLAAAAELDAAFELAEHAGCQLDLWDGDDD